MLNRYEKQNITTFLKKNTTYDVSLFLAGKTDSQINAIYQRIKHSMETYPKEIFNYLRNNPTVTPRYSLEELMGMSYNELSEIRKSLGIKKTRKKVTHQESGLTSTVQNANEVIKATSTRDLAASIISHQAIEKQERDLEILTEEEIFGMYGEQLSAPQLAELGIVLDKIPPVGEEDETDKRLDIIEELLNIGITIGTKPLSFSELILMSDEELHFLSHFVEETMANRERHQRLIK